MRRGQRVRRQPAKDFQCVPDSPALTKIVRELPRGCALRLPQVRSGLVVRQDPVVRPVPEALHRDFRSGPEDVPVQQSPLAASVQVPPVEFPRPNPENRSMPASRRRPADGRRSKNGMRKVNAGFIRYARAQALVRAAQRTWNQSHRYSGSHAP